ncbi:MAG: DUF501 domain-containing protein [Micrococcales bacterium]|nr:DUF501 domain-containing protein [Micrococcales bacterium]
MPRPPYPPPTEAEIAVVSEQLGRPARGVVGIAARCVCGNPVVVATAPRLPDGTPFPTFFYLTHPAATAALSTVEATGQMVELAELLQDAAVAERYRAAHDAYLADRATTGQVPEVAGVSAGGMPDRVKCLHALAAQSLAAGPGLNPIGDLALERAQWNPERCRCAHPAAAV